MSGVMQMCAVMSLGLSQANMAPGEPLDAAPFGEVRRWNEDGSDYGIYWEDPRDVFRVVVGFEEASPPAESLRLEYWQSSWPERRIPRDAPSGSGASGWLDIGDWYRGAWKAADANVQVSGTEAVFTFNPVNTREFPELADFAANYRTTLKVRVVGAGALPAVRSFRAFTDSRMKPLEFEVEWKGSGGEPRVEVFNGTLQGVEPLGHGFRAGILYAEPQGYNSFDETVVTLRAPENTFSFGARDLVRHATVFIPDYGVLVRVAGDATTYAEAERKWRGGENGRCVYDLVSEAPEQSLGQAWSDMPPKGRHYIPLSFEGGRQHFGLDENGIVFCARNWIAQIRGKDTDKCLWDGDYIRFTFGLPGVVTRRTLVDGALPIVESEFGDETLRYVQEAFVTPLEGVPRAGARIWADDPLVLLMRFRFLGLVSTTPSLEFGVLHGDGKEPLALEGDRIVAAGSEPRRLRMLVLEGAPYMSAVDGAVRFRCQIGAETPPEVVLAIPYTTMTTPEEVDRLRSLRFEEAYDSVREYWARRLQADAFILTPETMINDFYRAHLSHLLINTEREVGVSDRYMAKVGTFHYGVYSNESCMMVSDLDRRGHHERAEQALETWIHHQGTVPLPGAYKDYDGVFYGAGGYEHGGYNQHHGWVLWCLGEHYFYTRDGAWLERAAPAIAKGCDWIVRERRRNTEDVQGSALRAIEKGLLPPGSLEDIGDWRCWMSNNVFSWWGMDNAARALVAAGHSEGPRLAAEAAVYKEDIRAAFAEAMRRSPVVRLRDGSWVPQVPSDVHRRGRSFGWITETLEGAIYLIRCGVLEPWDPVSTWILKDYEDNRYISEQYGYPLEGAEFDRWWFSRGGISQQANLLCSPLPYLYRDQPEHFLRAYFNAFAASYFPDTRMMTEHALPNIGDWRGDHYKSSDEANSTYWLRLMFLWERGDELFVGAALPRYWLSNGQNIGIRRASTYFGRVSVTYDSRAAHGQIVATLEGDFRNPPSAIRVRFRHPDGRRMVRCDINGRAYDGFDPEKEWVEFPCDARYFTPLARVTAYYR